MLNPADAIAASKDAASNAQITPGTGVVGDTSALPDTPVTPVTPETPETPPQSTFDTLSEKPADEFDLANNAESYMDERGMVLSGGYDELDADTFGTEMDASKYQLDKNSININPETAQADTAASVVAKNPQGYVAETSQDKVKANLADSVTGTVGDNSLVDADSLGIDKQGVATGVNEDGSTNFTGEAVNAFASQNISRVIDTSTVAGKMLAEKLGEGNYLDSKATVMGQLEILTGEFTDPTTGEPKIPTWASGIARSVSRTIAFKGISGSAATQALATAMIEATLPIAEAESKFFQTLTEKNLSNKQEMVINKANVLSKLDQVDLDMRTLVATDNAKKFMEMDLTNINNEQEAALINSQSMVQSILEDVNQVNVANRFGAEQSNITDRFYDELNTTISTFNVAQKNQMEMFNTGERNDAEEFNATLENSREQFYRNMQFNVDLANTKWRQGVTETNSERSFDAAALDVKNLLDLTTEGLNQIWDRQDSLLDYAHTTSENEKDRDNKIEIAKLELDAALQVADREAEGADRAAKYDAAGNLIKEAVKSKVVKEGAKAVGEKIIKSAVGKKILAVGAKILGFFSDERLKENIEKYGELPNGVGLYTWDWNEKAVELGAEDLPTYGVIAQDARQYVPDAVWMGDDGYLRVDYSKVNV